MLAVAQAGAEAAFAQLVAGHGGNCSRTVVAC
jgi:hypothetical protein